MREGVGSTYQEDHISTANTFLLACRGGGQPTLGSRELCPGILQLHTGANAQCPCECVGGGSTYQEDHISTAKNYFFISLPRGWPTCEGDEIPRRTFSFLAHRGGGEPSTPPSPPRPTKRCSDISGRRHRRKTCGSGCRLWPRCPLAS